ncbi:MAG TPA: hypothetical protein VKZ85_11445 [Woeseiaceae bacterium]|nr:hypothetical protein [Woeseiaceae bacterium]
MTRPFILLTVAWSPLAAAAGITFSTPETVIHGPPSAIRLAISPDGAHQLWGEPRAPEDGGLDIRERRRLADGWSEPEDVAFNSPWNDFDPAFAADGSGVYFFSDRPGGLGGDDIWFVPLEGGAWGEPVNLGAPVNTPTDEWAPTPLPDGRLLFSSDGHPGLGGHDLYVSAPAAGGWTEPENLGAPVNSATHDYDAVLLPEGSLVLTRSDDPERGSELFWSCRLNAGYGRPERVDELNPGGGWALGPSIAFHEPGVLYFSAREPDAANIRIYRVAYTTDCPGA